MMSAPNIPAFGVITGQEFHRAEPATFVLPVPEFRLHRTTDYATVVLPLPGISNDLEVVRLL